MEKCCLVVRRQRQNTWMRLPSPPPKRREEERTIVECGGGREETIRPSSLNAVLVKNDSCTGKGLYTSVPLDGPPAPLNASSYLICSPPAAVWSVSCLLDCSDDSCLSRRRQRGSEEAKKRSVQSQAAVLESRVLTSRSSSLLQHEERKREENQPRRAMSLLLIFLDKFAFCSLLPPTRTEMMHGDTDNATTVPRRSRS